MSSEEKAKRLYGEAPEGDEAVDASREVPDPGEGSWSAQKLEPNTDYVLTAVPKQLTAGQLNSSHLGRQVKVEERYTHYRTGITGTLAGVEHGASLIDEGTFSDPGRVTLGKGWVLVTLLNYGGARVSPEATVELLD